MQNCKSPNNGNNVLERRDGELRLYDMTGNFTKVADWSETESAVASLDGELTAVEATLENCGRELAIDGQNLSLLGADDANVVAEYDATGIRVKARNRASSTDLTFDIELTDPTKYVFDPAKPVYWRYSAYNSSYYIYVPMTINEASYIPTLKTPADATSPLLCTRRSTGRHTIRTGLSSRSSRS